MKKFPILVSFLLAMVTNAQVDRPHVILVMADDMGWAQTGYYGHPMLKTPNLDAMAANGLRLDRFYAGAPSCTPTRASVMTGRNNDRTGAAVVGMAINKQEKMLSSAFQQAGYATAHFGKWHLNAVETPDHPLPSDDPHNPGALGFDYWLSETNQFNLNPELSRNGRRELFTGEGSEVLVDEALKFIDDEVANGNPVFVVIWYASPHRPFEALPADAKPFTPLVDQGSADHHGELVAMDRSIGALRQGLRDLKIADNTLIWFNSDNGGLPDIDIVTPKITYLGVHPDTTGHLRGFKKDFYEGGLRVPAVIEWPAGIEPRVSNFPSGTVDIFPTLMDVARLDPSTINNVHDGISLTKVFKSEPMRREKPMGFRASGGLMWLDNDWKLVKNNVDADFELYNVVGDPLERQDLMKQRPDVAARMGEQLAAWNASVDRSMRGSDYLEGIVLPTGRKPVTLDPLTPAEQAKVDEAVRQYQRKLQERQAE